MSVRSILGGMLLLAGMPGAIANAATVFNGDFETTSNAVGKANGKVLASLSTSNPSWDVYETIPGWTTVGGYGIEVQSNRTLGTIDNHTPGPASRYYVELDSENRPGGLSSNSSMQQSIALAPGRYVLKFWYSPRNTDINSNGIGYSVRNNASASLLAGGVTGPSATNNTLVGTWTLITSPVFTVAQGASPIQLKFTATGTANEYGGFIDDVSISAVPLPAASWLLISGLGALIAVARRRRQSGSGSTAA